MTRVRRWWAVLFALSLLAGTVPEAKAVTLASKDGPGMVR